MRLASPEIAAPFVHEVLSRDGAVWVHESSDSMAPLVRVGDRLCLVATEFADLRPGQLVAYMRGAQLVVHRILARSADSLITKGDGLAHRDAVVPARDVVGRVTVISTLRGGRIELDGTAWPALGRLLALVSRAGEWTRGSGLAWKLTRLPAHLAAWWVR
jgi:hypothetical protein